MTKIMDLENCCSCAACYNVCPYSAVTMEINERGFYTPKVNEQACRDCGLCEKVCPQMREKKSMTGSEKREAPVSYAAWCSQREPGSSGRAFYVFAKYIIAQGGVVFGAAYIVNLSKIILNMLDYLLIKNKLCGCGIKL